VNAHQYLHTVDATGGGAKRLGHVHPGGCLVVVQHRRIPFTKATSSTLQTAAREA